MRFGVQMFGLNPEFIKDKEYFLQRMTKAGFCFMEPCLSLTENPGLAEHIWLPGDFDENAALLEKYGVKLSSIFAFTGDLFADAEAILAVAKAHGVPQITISCPGFESLEQYQAAAENLMKAADVFRAENIDVMLHNDRSVSEIQVEGMSAYEWIFRHCGGKVFAQPDAGYLVAAGVDAESFLWKNQAYIRSFHYKDYKINGDSVIETEIGTGCVDVPACYRFCKENGIIQIIDQDGFEGDPLDAVDRLGKLLGGLS